MLSSAFLTGLAWFLLVGYVLTALEFFIGNRSLKRLSSIPPITDDPQAALPRVSIIIPARNEQKNIEEALTSVLHLDYPNYEIWVLNDRSEDTTGDILERMSLQYPQLNVAHIQTLPEGWLGKNHALYFGAKKATGEILLFTDADVVMESSTLRRAVQTVQQFKLDHIALLPDLKSQNFALHIFVSTFSMYFALYARPWLARFSKLPWHIGVGAFNLIRRDVYEKIGTHQAIALRPDDDIKLGKLVKKHGFKQDVLLGQTLIAVEWYSSLNELVHGLMKNAYSGLGYNLGFMSLGVLAQFLFGVWPLVGVLVSHGMTRVLYLAVLIVMQLLCLDNALYYGTSLWCGPLFPLSTLFMIYIICRATVLTHIHQGIFWRGTYYPLSQLRANRV